MHRIDDATATIDSQFTEGDPTAGTLATVVKADWLNSVQEEIAGVVEGAGITLSKPDNSQLATAIDQRILAEIAAAAPGSATSTADGLVELATNAEAQGLTDGTRAITASTLNQALKGSNQSLTTNGYQRLPGGLILQWGSFLTSGGDVTVNFPIAFPTACLNVQVTCTSSAPNAYIPTVTITSAAACDINAANGSGVGINVGFCWFAIGY